MPLHVPTTLSCFAGALVRHGTNVWRWRDGKTESRVHELATNLWHVPQRPFTDRIELPFSQAQAYDPLAWVITRYRDGRYELDVSSWFPALRSVADTGGDTTARVANRQAVMVVLIPIADWKPWRVLCPVVPLWNPADEADLFAEARRHGWHA